MVKSHDISFSTQHMYASYVQLFNFAFLETWVGKTGHPRKMFWIPCWAASWPPMSQHFWGAWSYAWIGAKKIGGHLKAVKLVSCASGYTCMHSKDKITIFFIGSEPRTKAPKKLSISLARAAGLCGKVAQLSKKKIDPTPDQPKHYFIY